MLVKAHYKPPAHCTRCVCECVGIFICVLVWMEENEIVSHVRPFHLHIDTKPLKMCFSPLRKILCICLSVCVCVCVCACVC